MIRDYVNESRNNDTNKNNKIIITNENKRIHIDIINYIKIRIAARVLLNLNNIIACSFHGEFNNKRIIYNI